VASVSHPAQTAVSAPTPSDPNVADGFYFLFSPGTGCQLFTAAKTRYASVTTAVNVRPGQASTGNLARQEAHKGLAGPRPPRSALSSARSMGPA
jgi:hypothetical protein